jgi:hypothetical protein
VSSSPLDEVVLLSDELPGTEADSETDKDELLTTTGDTRAAETAAAVKLCDFFAFFCSCRLYIAVMGKSNSRSTRVTNNEQRVRSPYHNIEDITNDSKR